MSAASSYDAEYYNRDCVEQWYTRHGLLRPDQLAAVAYTLGWLFRGDEEVPARPEVGPIVSVGCGTGFLEAELERIGYQVTGVDSSEAARSLYTASEVIPAWDGRDCRTLLFVESLEHIPLEQTMFILGDVHRCRVVVVNFETFHPIYPDHTGWDHITLVDEALFDRIAAFGTQRLRRGGHLVVDIP